MRNLFIYIIKTLLEIALLYYIYLETGIFTTIFAVIVLLGFEGTAFLLGKLTTLLKEIHTAIEEKVQKADFLITEIEKLKSKGTELKSLTIEDINELSFSEEPLTLEDILLMKKVEEEKDISSVISLIKSRCLNKNYNFEKAQFIHLDILLGKLGKAVAIGAKKRSEEFIPFEEYLKTAENTDFPEFLDDKHNN